MVGGRGGWGRAGWVKRKRTEKELGLKGGVFVEKDLGAAGRWQDKVYLAETGDFAGTFA